VGTFEVSATAQQLEQAERCNLPVRFHEWGRLLLGRTVSRITSGYPVVQGSGDGGQGKAGKLL